MSPKAAGADLFGLIQSKLPSQNNLPCEYLPLPLSDDLKKAVLIETPLKKLPAATLCCEEEMKKKFVFLGLGWEVVGFA